MLFHPFKPRFCATVNQRVLTDASSVYNVIVQNADLSTVMLGAIDGPHAHAIADAINAGAVFFEA